MFTYRSRPLTAPSDDEGEAALDEGAALVDEDASALDEKTALLDESMDSADEGASVDDDGGASDDGDSALDAVPLVEDGAVNEDGSVWELGGNALEACAVDEDTAAVEAEDAPAPDEELLPSVPVDVVMVQEADRSAHNRGSFFTGPRGWVHHVTTPRFSVVTRCRDRPLLRGTARTPGRTSCASPPSIARSRIPRR